MISKFFSALEARFGTKVAACVMSVLLVMMLVGVIVSFKVNFVLGIIMLFVAITPVVVGLVTVLTWGHVNLAVIINDLLFHTSVGSTVIMGLALVALGLLVYRFPDMLNEWAKGKIFIK